MMSFYKITTESILNCGTPRHGTANNVMEDSGSCLINGQVPWKIFRKRATGTQFREGRKI